MDLVNGEKDYNLPEPITVFIKDQGGDVEVSLLTLHEPRREHIKYSARMKQMVTRAVMEVSEKHKGEEQVILGEEAKAFHEKTNKEHQKESEEMAGLLNLALYASETVDLGDFVENFISMATKAAKKNIVMCDAIVPIKDIHFDQMSDETVTDLAITYASFFLMPSVMQSK